MNSYSEPTCITPNSPISPSNNLLKTHFTYDNFNYLSATSVLESVGFTDCVKIADSLQGSVWRVTRTSSKGIPKRYVIKTANQTLYTHSHGVVGGNVYNVKEDIILEQSILKYLTQDIHCPKSIVKWHQFFKTETDLYFVMEDAGCSLFDFVTKAQKFVRSGKIDIRHWHRVCHMILGQMIECIDYIHSKRVAHFDISLENFLILDPPIDVTKVNGHDRITFVLDDFQVKLCDFGLANLFTNTSFRSSKHCGKTKYSSPEVVSKKIGFNARSNDIWCMGLCMFLLCTGISPWNIADESDANYAFIQKFGLRKAMEDWDVLYTVDGHMLNILQAILQQESDRASLQQIKRYLSRIYVKI